MTMISDYIGIKLDENDKAIKCKLFLYSAKLLNDEQWSNKDILERETSLARRSIIEMIFGEFRKDLQNLNRLICLEKTQEAADLLDTIMDKMYDASPRKQNDN